MKLTSISFVANYDEDDGHVHIHYRLLRPNPAVNYSLCDGQSELNCGSHPFCLPVRRVEEAPKFRSEDIKSTNLNTNSKFNIIQCYLH